MSDRMRDLITVATAVAITLIAWGGSSEAVTAQDGDVGSAPTDFNDLSATIDDESRALLTKMGQLNAEAHARETVAKCLAMIDKRLSSDSTAAQVQRAELRLRLLSTVLSNGCVRDKKLLTKCLESYRVLASKFDGTELHDARRAKLLIMFARDAIAVHESIPASQEFLRQEIKAQTGMIMDVVSVMLAQSLITTDATLGSARQEASALLSGLAESKFPGIPEQARGWLGEVDHLSVGHVLPTFEAVSLDGKIIEPKFDRASVVLIRIISSRCGACQSSPEELTRLRRAFPETQLRIVLGVMSEDRQDDLLFALVGAGAKKWPFEVVLERDPATIAHEPNESSMFSRLHVVGTPKTFVVAPGGRIVDVLYGTYRDDALSSIVHSAISAVRGESGDAPKSER